MARHNAEEELVFLKLGGSLLTDKTALEALRGDVLGRLAEEIMRALSARPQLRLVLGHGSGSFGHVAAAKYATRVGVNDAQQWMGFARVSDAAARLNRKVCAAFLEAGLPVVSLQPSASALCEGGRIVSLATRPIIESLRSGLVPIIYGDVAFDTERGGTIISTEEILSYLALYMRPTWLFLAGETEGVLDPQGNPIPVLDSRNVIAFESSLGGSHGTDVTGGMISKVKSMLDLVDQIDSLSVRIFSGLYSGNVSAVLLGKGQNLGTVISRAKDSS